MKKIITVSALLILLSAVTFAQESKQAKTSAKDIKVTNGTESTNAVTYDFTTGSDKYYGGASGAVEIEAGVWGMIAGDVNQSGIITNSDKDLINTEVNLSGYYDSDVNMSGIVTNSDKDLINANVNKSTQVPN